MDHLALVVVNGLRNDDPVTSTRGNRFWWDEMDDKCLWDSYWLRRMGYDNCHVVVFDAGFQQISNEVDFLSPSWFDQKAKDLLVKVKKSVKPDALILADADNAYNTISKLTCACVLFGVPHKAPSLQEWSHLIVSMVLPFWKFLPEGFWKSTAALPEYLVRTSSDFIAVAFSIAIISVCQPRSDVEDQVPVIIDMTCGILEVSHEHVVVQNAFTPFSQITTFSRFEYDKVYQISAVIKDAAEGRQYMKTLSRLSPYTRFPEHDGIQPLVDAIKKKIEHSGASNINLYEDRGNERSTLSFALYENLIRGRGSTEYAAYFAFDSRDHRRRSVSAMLIKLMRQLLSYKPSLINKVLDERGDYRTRWTEGNLWIQLRSIIRQMQSSCIHLVIDTVNDCKTDSPHTRFLQNVFDLRFAAPSQLKIWCTSTTRLEDLKEVGLECINIRKEPEFAQYWIAFRNKLADIVVSESPKLMALEDDVKECLEISEVFLHASLIAHRIRGIDSLSRLSCLKADVLQLKIGWKDTIMAFLQGTPSWVAKAVSWVIFARRPLRPTELSVAVALSDSPLENGHLAELDESSIPYHIEGDMKHQLGPLITIEQGEIKVAHPYATDILREWIEPKQDSEAQRLGLLLEYLRLCLRTIYKEDSIPGSLAFSFFEYALENWHMHYRDVMDNANFGIQPEDKGDLEKLAGTLFDRPEYMHWLASWQYLSPEPEHQEHDVAPGSIESLLRPVLLASRLGLFNIFSQLFDSISKDKRLDALQLKALRLDALKIACENGHLKMVYYLIDETTDPSVLEGLLFEACERGDEQVITTLIVRLQEIPTQLLSNVCSIGHMSVVKTLILYGAEVDAYAEGQTSPLHAAIHQGHLGIVELLIENGANINLVTEKDWTPLQCSISKGYKFISERLLKEAGLQDNINKDNLTGAHLAARMGDIDLLRRVIDLERSKPTENGEDHLYQSLHEAASNGHLEAVKILLEHGVPINGLNSDKETALFVALSKNRAEVVNFLLDKDATITAGIEYPGSALKQAIIHGNWAASIALLSKGEDANGGSCNDSSPLIDATRRDHIDIFKALILSNADIYRQVTHDEVGEILDENVTSGWAAVHFAAYYGSLKIIRLLVDLEPRTFDSQTTSGHTPLHLAVFNNMFEIVKILLNDGSSAVIAERKGSISRSSRSSTPGPETLKSHPIVMVDAVSRKCRTPLHIAVTNDTLRIVKLLLDNGASAWASDTDGKTPLHFAVASTSSENLKDVIDILHSKGADPAARDEHDETPLHYAAQCGNATAVPLLLQIGSHIELLNRSGLTPLYMAAQAGHERVVNELLNHGADVNTSNRKGYTALHVAAFAGHVKVVDKLLDYGAYLDSSDEKCDTPLHEAARRGKDEVVKSLIKKGAYLDIINSVRVTPLQRAVLNNWPLSAELLLEAGANPNICDEDGDTALTAAIFKNSRGMLDILLKQSENGNLKYNVNLDFMDNRGRTPLIRVLWMPEMIEVLLNAGANASLCDKEGRTVLHEIARGYSTDETESIILPLLLRNDFQAKKQLGCVDSEGLTPIHLAARRGNGSLIAAFRAYGDDLISIKDSQGRTAMHHAVRTLSKDSMIQAFGDFLTPSESNQVNIPDFDGWTPLHWACKGSQNGVVEMLLSRYKYPIRVLRYEGKHGWTAMAIAISHDNDDAINVIQRCAMAMDPELDDSYIPSPFSLREPPTSVEEAFQGRDISDDISVSSYHISTEWKTAVRHGLRSDGKKVVVGERHRGITCDDCNYYIYGARFKCRFHRDFDLCFKCYWHSQKTHEDHTFNMLGGSPITGPIILDVQPKSSPPSSPTSSPAVEPTPWREEWRRPLPTQINSISRPSSPLLMGFPLSRRRIRSPSPSPLVRRGTGGDRVRMLPNSRAMPSSIYLDGNEYNRDPSHVLSASRKDSIIDRLSEIERERGDNMSFQGSKLGTSDEHKSVTVTKGMEAKTTAPDDKLKQDEIETEIPITKDSTTETKEGEPTEKEATAEEMTTKGETEIEVVAEELEDKTNTA
ncbi:hypothetical protein ACHAQJ_000314 [Trichoderma viride]